MSELMLRLARWDQRLLHTLVTRRQPLLDEIMRGVTHLGDAVVVTAIGLVLLSGVIPALAQAGVEAAFTLAVSHAGVQLVKRTIHRPRPEMPVGFASLIEAPDRFSFPSGHAAASLSLLLPVALYLPGPAAALLLGLAGAVGVSRCYLGVHYPGDVVAGWALALGTFGLERVLLDLPPLM